MATASHTLATMARTLAHSLIPSRNTTWVATAAGRRPSSARTCDSIAGSMLEYVPTDPERGAVGQRVVAERRGQRGCLGQQQVSGLGELQRQPGVQQVGRGHPEV